MLDYTGIAPDTSFLLLGDREIARSDRRSTQGKKALVFWLSGKLSSARTLGVPAANKAMVSGDRASAYVQRTPT